MTWTTPEDWDVGEILTAADLNKINANLNALKAPPSDFKKGSGTANYSSSSTSFVVVDASLNLSLTTTGGDIMIGFSGTGSVAASTGMVIDAEVDGVRIGTYSTGGGLIYNSQPAIPMSFVTLATGISAGVHSIKLVWKMTTGTSIALYNNVTQGIPTFWAREV